MELKNLVNKINKVECYKRYIIHNSLKKSEIYFGQPPVLDYLFEHGKCTQKELSDAIGVSAASIAVSIKRMQKSGMVAKINDENDLRCNRITLTKKGEEQLRLIHECFDNFDKQMFSGFTEEELCAYGNFLDRILENLSSDIPKGKNLMELFHEEMKSHSKGGDNENG